MGRGDAEDLSEEYRQILQSLKGTAEGLLINQVSNVWNIYGGLNRLHHVMEKIFKHRCRVFDPDGDPDCWVFIQGLSWLQPSLSASPSLLTDEDCFLNLPPSVSGKALVWLYKSLEGHTLSQKLSWLLSDRDHLLSCFEKSAYLCQEKYGKATLICLRAVEQNQPSLLSEIDPCLYLASWNFRVFHKTHRKCSSFPETRFNPRYPGRRRYLLEKQKSADTHLSEIMSRAPVKKSPLGTGCFGSDIRDADKEEEQEEDRQSFCEEATECTFAGDNDSAATNESNNQEDESASLENSAATTTTEAKPQVIVQTVKRWYSLPSLVNAADSEVSRDALSSTSDGNSSSCAKPVVHSYPSSPTRGPSRSSSLAFRSAGQSPLETSTSISAQSPCSKLSPSVLEVDYNTIEQHSDSDVPTSQRCSRNWRNGNVKLVNRSTCLKRQLFSGDELSVKFRPFSARCPAVMNTLVTSSGSSDTLNHEANRLNKLTQATSSKGNSWLQTSVRPNELKLPGIQWEESELDTSGSQSRIKKPSGKMRRVSLGMVGSAPEYAHEWMGAVDGSRRRVHKKSFIEDGGSSVLPMATGFFPRPVQGQSLASFLSSGQFARPSAELDRENAHFSVCEAMIAAIELVKCNQQLAVAVVSKGRPSSDRDRSSGSRAVAGAGSGPADESDEDANPLKQRIRLRRRQRQQQRRQIQVWNSQLLSDGRTDTTTTDQSISPLSSSPGTPSESLSTDGVDDLEVDEVQNLAQLKNSGLSVSMASLYSEADLSRTATATASRAPDAGLTESVVSAEGVALSLLRQFSDKQLPRASDLQWLVSEQDAPQQLLPLPTSWPVSPDEAEDADMRQATPLRGTTDWAPPRPQVIFTPHPSPVRRVLMAKQNYRCAGCGMKVAVEYSHRYRYCEYLGRFFCTGCHTNQLAIIPGRVLTRWDFTRCPVSNFSYRLLDQMTGDPLFRISDLNPGLYRKARQLERARQLRLQLFYIKDFIFTCRFAEELQEVLKKEPSYIVTDLDIYSLTDLQQVKTGELPNHFRDLILNCTQHIAECSLCCARGFVCELCTSKEVIFPWQLTRVAQCGSCGQCFHASCWSGRACPRCRRRSARKHSEGEITVAPEAASPSPVTSSVAAVHSLERIMSKSKLVWNFVTTMKEISRLLWNFCNLNMTWNYLL